MAPRRCFALVKLAHLNWLELRRRVHSWAPRRRQELRSRVCVVNRKSNMSAVLTNDGSAHCHH